MIEGADTEKIPCMSFNLLLKLSTNDSAIDSLVYFSLYVLGKLMLS